MITGFCQSCLDTSRMSKADIINPRELLNPSSTVYMKAHDSPPNRDLPCATWRWQDSKWGTYSIPGLVKMPLERTCSLQEELGFSRHSAGKAFPLTLQEQIFQTLAASYTAPIKLSIEKLLLWNARPSAWHEVCVSWPCTHTESWQLQPHLSDVSLKTSRLLHALHRVQGRNQDWTGELHSADTALLNHCGNAVRLYFYHRW